MITSPAQLAEGEAIYETMLADRANATGEPIEAAKHRARAIYLYMLAEELREILHGEATKH